MKSLGDIALAVKYSFSGFDKKPLADIVNESTDAAMPLYVLQRRFAVLNVSQLTMSLLYAATKQDETGWTRFIKQAQSHPAAPQIDTNMVKNYLVSSVFRSSVENTRVLLTFPQVTVLTRYNDWKDILFYALPNDHPEKRALESRDFEARDGHPDILAMIREKMKDVLNPPKQKAKPKSNLG